MRKESKKINWVRDQDLTIEEIKDTDGLRLFTDDQAMEVIRIFKIYCGIIYCLHKKEVEGEADYDELMASFNNENESFKKAA